MIFLSLLLNVLLIILLVGKYQEKEIGWVNVFETIDGRLIITPMPKKTKKLCLENSSEIPKSKYIKTTKIYTKDFW